MIIAILIYTGMSLVVGGAAANEIWRCPLMCHRADGRRKFSGEVIFFGLFVALLWPFLVVPVCEESGGNDR